MSETETVVHDLTAWNCNEPYDGMTHADRLCKVCSSVCSECGKTEATADGAGDQRWLCEACL